MSERTSSAQRQRYRQAVDTAPWEEFRFTIEGVREFDGEYRVGVKVDGGIGAVPKFMIEWGLIQFAPTDGAADDVGIVVVRIDHLGGETGIQAVP